MQIDGTVLSEARKLFGGAAWAHEPAGHCGASVNLSWEQRFGEQPAVRTNTGKQTFVAEVLGDK